MTVYFYEQCIVWSTDHWYIFTGTKTKQVPSWSPWTKMVPTNITWFTV